MLNIQDAASATCHRQSAARLKLTERGSTIVQYAIVLPPMMFILLVAFDLLRLSYHSAVTEFVVADTVRYAILMKPAADRVVDIRNRAKAKWVRQKPK